MNDNPQGQITNFNLSTSVKENKQFKSAIIIKAFLLQIMYIIHDENILKELIFHLKIAFSISKSPKVNPPWTFSYHNIYAEHNRRYDS